MEESVKESKELLNLIKDAFSIEEKDPKQYSPLTLAYIGDAIYDLIIRTLLVELGNAPVNRLHRQASSMVKATAQAFIIRKLEPELSEEELSVYKRGRNAKSATAAKNADIADYRTATGFEALIGYLYMAGRMERVMELVKQGLEYLWNEDKRTCVMKN